MGIGDKFLILIIDNDPSIIALYKAKLELSGYSVESSGSGDGALELIGLHNPDLVLMELKLPNLPGIDVIKYLRAKDKFIDLPIIVLAADGEDDTRRNVMGAGADLFLIKSEENPKSVIEHVVSQLDGKTPKPQTEGINIREVPTYALKDRSIVTKGTYIVPKEKKAIDAPENLPITRGAIIGRSGEEMNKDRESMAKLASEITELKSLLSTEKVSLQKAIEESNLRAKRDLDSIRSQMSKIAPQSRGKLKAEEKEAEVSVKQRMKLVELGENDRRNELEQSIHALKGQLEKKEKVWEAEILKKEKLINETREQLIKANERLESEGASKQSLVMRQQEAEKMITLLETDIIQLKTELAHVQNAREESEPISGAASMELEQTARLSADEMPLMQIQKPTPKPGSYFSKKYRFLILEDDPIISRLYKTKLELLGQEAYDTSNGGLALQMAKSKKPDFLILDIRLPDIDGFDFLNLLKSNDIYIPFLVLSNADDAELKKKAHELGAIDYLIKADAIPKKVIELIRDYLDR